MILLIDADVIFHQMAYRNEYTIEWDEDCTSKIIDEDRAYFDTDEFIANLLDKTECEDCICCISSDWNFRYKVLPTYKHNRVSVVKPDLNHKLNCYIQDNYPHKRIKWLEADDILGIMASKEPDKYMIATIDKDLKQIPCKQYHWHHKKFYDISEDDGDYLFYKQWIMGDSVDGYSGVPKVGKVGASKLLDNTDREDWEDAIFELYASKGIGREEALQQARVARILRHTEWDFKKKEYKLWMPKK